MPGEVTPPEGTLPKPQIGTPAIANPDSYLFRIHEQCVGTARDVQHIRGDLDKVDPRLSRIEEKISSLTHWRALVIGGFIVVTAILSVAVSLVWKDLKGSIKESDQRAYDLKIKEMENTSKQLDIQRDAQNMQLKIMSDLAQLKAQVEGQRPSEVPEKR